MQCLYCGQTFEDPKRFEKHRCKVMKRMEMITSSLLDTYISYSKHINNKKIKKTDTEEILKFLKSSSFDFIMKLDRFCSENELNQDDYIKSMLFLKFRKDKWTTPNVLERYIIYRANHEPDFIGVERSEKYLTKKNIDIMKLSSGELYNLIKDGWVSKHYFSLKKIDLKTLLPKEMLDDLWEVL